MNAKALLYGSLVLTILGTRPARAQDITPPAYTDELQPSPLETPPDRVAPPGRLSDWITYICPDCYGHTSLAGYMGGELYTRSGWSIPWQGGVLRLVAETGWFIQGGGRVLFFNEPLNRAWTVDVSISNVYNHGQRPDVLIPLILRDPRTATMGQPLSLTTTLQMLNRTSVNLTLGQEYYWNSLTKACNSHWNWRWGWDAGGSYGTERADLDVSPPITPTPTPSLDSLRRNDVIGGALFALHSDVEVPCGCCTWFGGVRAELHYTWSDIFQAQKSADILDINLLLSLGVRF
jgi:hypothetical protein